MYQVPSLHMKTETNFSSFPVWMLWSAQFCVLDFTIMDVKNFIYFQNRMHFQNHIQNVLHTLKKSVGSSDLAKCSKKVSCLYTYIYYRSKLWGWKEYL